MECYLDFLQLALKLFLVFGLQFIGFTLLVNFLFYKKVRAQMRDSDRLKLEFLINSLSEKVFDTSQLFIEIYFGGHCTLFSLEFSWMLKVNILTQCVTTKPRHPNTFIP